MYTYTSKTRVIIIIFFMVVLVVDVVVAVAGGTEFLELVRTSRGVRAFVVRLCA